MIQVKYGELSNTSLQNYYEFLIGKLFKILPMKEQNCSTLQSYLKSLQRELIGNSRLLYQLKDEPQFISLLNIIQFFIDEEYNIEDCKSEVFRAISIVKDINKKYFKGG